MKNPIEVKPQEYEPIKPDVNVKSKKIIQILDKAYQQIRQHNKNDSSKNFINRISLNLEQQKIEDALTNLVKGYLIKKHSQSTKEPHSKYLYISEDYRFLCWKSVDKNDEKMLELNKIDLIVQDRQLGQFRRSTTMRSNKGNCFIIMCQIRNLQIQCISEQEAEKIVYQLEEAVKNSKRMHLSYRF